MDGYYNIANLFTFSKTGVYPKCCFQSSYGIFAPRCGKESYMCLKDIGCSFSFFCKWHSEVMECTLGEEEEIFLVSEIPSKTETYKQLKLNHNTGDDDDTKSFLRQLPKEVTLTCNGCGKEASHISIGWHEQDDFHRSITWCSSCQSYVRSFDGGELFKLSISEKGRKDLGKSLGRI
jgi:hypothetical protein